MASRYVKTSYFPATLFFFLRDWLHWLFSYLSQASGAARSSWLDSCLSLASATEIVLHSNKYLHPHPPDFRKSPFNDQPEYTLIALQHKKELA